jgi:DNA-binding beta-propeller fold protein YncE
VGIALAAALVGVGWLVVGGRGGRRAPEPTAGDPTTAAPVARTSRPPGPLEERAIGALDQPLQDAAATPLDGGRVLLLGGLTASDVSTDAIREVGAGGARLAARLPVALHDAAAVRLGNHAYLFGGGDGAAQHDEIIAVGGGTAGGRTVGRLPAKSSDQAAAGMGGTAYIVGGYTGRAWLDTIVAWRPGGPARVVAHLPVPLRYAAVAAADGRLVIAGGSTPTGLASDAVLVFDPKGGGVRPVGRLPAGTTHAAAAAVGDAVYVIGGRGAVPGTPTPRIVRVEPIPGRVTPAGRLATARSDLAAVAVGGRILLAGGRTASGATARLSELVPRPAGGSASPAVSESRPRTNVYRADEVGHLARAVRALPERIYVPNSASDTVDVIDARTFRIIRHFAVGALPQHVTPSWDLRTLYVDNDQGNSLTPIDPRTGRPGRSIPVADPYNLYFTPDGRRAIVVAERNARLDFRDPHTFRLLRSVPVPCRGVDHMDFSADGRTALASCEFSSQLVQIDLVRERVVRTIRLDGGAGMPQDVKLAPDGRLYYVADMMRGGVWEIDARSLHAIGFLPTGAGAHGLYPSRNARLLYVSNRSAGTVSVLSFRTRRIVATWRIPGGSPDMGGVSADGRTLWLSGRYDGEVYAIDTRTGRLRARIPVGAGPHGLSVWPQPGRHSLGHTGIMR